MVILLFTLLISTFSHADGLVLLSGEESSLAGLPKAIIAAFEESGVPLSRNENMFSLELTSLECLRTAAGAVSCTYLLAGKDEPKRLPGEAIFSALESLNREKEGLKIGQCGKDGACEFALASVSCMMNSDLSETAQGKYGCGFVSR